MREIKFRVYDQKKKKMFPAHKLEWNKISNELVHLSGVDIHDKDSDYAGDVYYGGHPTKMTGSPGTHQIKRYELMQYTGLKDRNGKEIYEGDIIESEEIGYTESGHFSGMKKVVGNVVFTIGRFAIHRTNGALPDLLMGLSYHKVIGNIYENTEMLEK